LNKNRRYNHSNFDQRTGLALTTHAFKTIPMNPVNHFYNTVSDSICQRLLLEIPSHYKYHSLRHTLDVIQQCHWIGQAEGLNEYEMQIVRVAALFHDIGYITGRKNHEERSCELFREQAMKHALPAEDQLLIEGCIMATKISQTPTNHLERVICDADLDYLGREDFEEIGDLLFQELSACGEITDRQAWNELQIRFLTNHRFHTRFGQQKRQAQLQAHLQKLVANQ
jgi:uncharacterized protein